MAPPAPDSRPGGGRGVAGSHRRLLTPLRFRRSHRHRPARPEIDGDLFEALLPVQLQYFPDLLLAALNAPAAHGDVLPQLLLRQPGPPRRGLTARGRREAILQLLL